MSNGRNGSISEQVTELKITVLLLDGDKEVATVERYFGLVETQETNQNQDAPTKTIDGTITEFLQEMEQSARERGYAIVKESLTEAAVSSILFLVKPAKPELTLNIHVERPEQEEKLDDSGEKTDT